MTNGEKIVIGTDGMGRPRRVLNESGKFYGRLEVLKLSRHRRQDRIAWRRCRCSCGRETVVRGVLLRNGSTTSCGCCWDEMRLAGAHRLPVGEASWRRALGRAESSADRKNIKWGLTHEESKTPMTSPCRYCGVGPSNMMRGVNGEFRWNGIDRVVPRGGYVMSNCVSCCIACNRLKSNTPYDLFVGRCLATARNIQSRQVDNIAKGR